MSTYTTYFPTFVRMSICCPFLLFLWLRILYRVTWSLPTGRVHGLCFCSWLNRSHFIITGFAQEHRNLCCSCSSRDSIWGLPESPVTLNPVTSGSGFKKLSLCVFSILKGLAMAVSFLVGSFFWCLRYGGYFVFRSKFIEVWLNGSVETYASFYCFAR